VTVYQIACCIDTSNIVCMKFLFPDCIIIRYKHNHIIKLVTFSRLAGGGGGGFPLVPSMQCTALLDLYYVSL
jgi:hypothetical protein